MSVSINCPGLVSMATKTTYFWEPITEWGRRAQDDDDHRAALFISSMAATEVQQPFKAAVDCVLNKLEGKFTLKIEQKLAYNKWIPQDSQSMSPSSMEQMYNKTQ